MNIYGIQKLSLVDFDDEVSCTLFTGGCNFNCSYCHNSELAFKMNKDIKPIDNKEIVSYLESKKGLLSAVCITGGEPTINASLKDFCIYVKSLGYKIKLDTNGTNPRVLINLIEEKLIDYVAIDIKNSKEKYAITVGLKNLDLSKINESIEYLIKNDFPYEFRTTLVEQFHNENDIEEIGKWLKGAKKIFLQRFEMSDFVIDKSLKEIKKEDALKFKCILEKYIILVSLRGY